MWPYGAAQALMELPDARPRYLPEGAVRGMRGIVWSVRKPDVRRSGPIRAIVPALPFPIFDPRLSILIEPAGSLFLRGFLAVTICLRV